MPNLESLLAGSGNFCTFTLGYQGLQQTYIIEALLGGKGGGVHVAHLNFETSCVGVYKCLSLIVSFSVTFSIWSREVVSCRDFILSTVATFWAMLLVRIYPGRAS